MKNKWLFEKVFTKKGEFVRKIPIRFVDIAAGMTVTDNDEIVVVDSVSPTVFRITEFGELKLWFDCAAEMREPSDIVVHGSEYYICDFKVRNHFFSSNNFFYFFPL